MDENTLRELIEAMQMAMREGKRPHEVRDFMLENGYTEEEILEVVKAVKAEKLKAQEEKADESKADGDRLAILRKEIKLRIDAGEKPEAFLGLLISAGYAEKDVDSVLASYNWASERKELKESGKGGMYGK
jgi:hypothetical protein